jgi:hypothetical protein
MSIKIEVENVGLLFATGCKLLGFACSRCALVMGRLVPVCMWWPTMS